MPVFTPTTATGPTCRVLLVIPGDVNYFYNLYARWMAVAFRELGAQVELCELPDVTGETHDLCILSNVSEILHSVGEGGRDRIAALRRSVGAMINFSAECVKSRWFRGNLDACRELGIGGMLDIGFFDQRADLDERHGPGSIDYHFAFDGLLAAQARGPRPPADPSTRTIPWAHVGMRTPSRIALTDRLITGIAPDGLIYLPEVSPVKEKDSPHLDPRQMERILVRTKYYVWCTHHEHFYMESLRFRTAWSTGCLPIKIIGDGEPMPDGLPFSDWVVREGEVVERLGALDFEGSRKAFEREYLHRPRLDAGLAALLADHGFEARATHFPREEEPAARPSKCA